MVSRTKAISAIALEQKKQQKIAPSTKPFLERLTTAIYIDVNMQFKYLLFLYVPICVLKVDYLTLSLDRNFA